MLKKCSMCNQIKTPDAFYIRNDGRYRTDCKTCRQAVEKRRRIENPNRFWHIHRRAALKYRYGITLEKYNDLAQKQNNQCAICARNVSDNKMRRLSVDHDHKTGRMRGLLCSACNRGIGYLADDVSRVVSAARYLIDYQNAEVLEGM